ncbi:MAG: hypothetical protein EU531_01600 [Promethearchaeota archaeon]|nr:MAG: hypothetical protein EU531_01600 [Candidatus Lokiarchaeota archaeon]
MKIRSLLIKKGKVWILLYGVYVGLFLIYLLFIPILEPYWAEINITVSGWVGFDFNIIFFIFIIILVPLIYGLVLLIVNLRRIIINSEKKPHMFHKILPIVLFVLYTILIFIFIELLEDYKYMIFQFFEFYSYFIFLGIDIVLILLIYPLVKYKSKLKLLFSERFLSPENKTLIFISIIIIGYITSLIIPLTFLPANIIDGSLPQKPKLIAHRGASYIAPENTIKAGEVALGYSEVIGWEVDIQISFDGVPFLMHDHTLKRTTNVSDHFPNRKDEDPSLFTISELKELDAGSWFVEKDPYGSISKGIISSEKAATYRGLRIPTFEEVLNFTRDNNLSIDFDPYQPPESHPYHDEFYEILLNLTLDSGINLSKVMIPTTNLAFLQLINSTTPEVLLGWGGNPSINEFQSSPFNYTYINSGDGYNHQEYRNLINAGLDIMVWTIESIERFSQLWCLGIKWVKTNSPYKFNALESPIFYLDSFSYCITWIIMIIAFVFLVLFLSLSLPKRVKEIY